MPDVGLTVVGMIVVAGLKTMFRDIESRNLLEALLDQTGRKFGENVGHYVGKWRCGINMAISSIVPQERNRNSPPALFCMPNLKRRVRN